MGVQPPALSRGSKDAAMIIAATMLVPDTYMDAGRYVDIKSQHGKELVATGL